MFTNLIAPFVVAAGMALGMVMQLPEEADETSVSRTQLLAKLDVCMGGRVAEELIFGDKDVTTGASSDLEQVQPWSGCSVRSCGGVEPAFSDGYTIWKTAHASSMQQVPALDRWRDGKAVLGQACRPLDGSDWHQPAAVRAWQTICRGDARNEGDPWRPHLSAGDALGACHGDAVWHVRCAGQGLRQLRRHGSEPQQRGRGRRWRTRCVQRAAAPEHSWPPRRPSCTTRCSLHSTPSRHGRYQSSDTNITSAAMGHKQPQPLEKSSCGFAWCRHLRLFCAIAGQAAPQCRV